MNATEWKPASPWRAGGVISDLGDLPTYGSVLATGQASFLRNRRNRVLDTHTEVKELFDKRWLHLFALQDGEIA